MLLFWDVFLSFLLCKFSESSAVTGRDRGICCGSQLWLLSYHFVWTVGKASHGWENSFQGEVAWLCSLFLLFNIKVIPPALEDARGSPMHLI